MPNTQATFKAANTLLQGPRGDVTPEALAAKIAAESARDIAIANAELTEADAIATAADRVQTGQDRTATGQDRTQTGLDRVATGQDAVATAADRVQTGLDRVATGQDKTATAADRVATGQDKTATAADRVQTGLDRAATAADRVATGADAMATAGDRVATAADRVATGQDRTATGADRVQTGLDRTAVANDKTEIYSILATASPRAIATSPTYADASTLHASLNQDDIVAIVKDERYSPARRTLNKVNKVTLMVDFLAGTYAQADLIEFLSFDTPQIVDVPVNSAAPGFDGAIAFSATHFYFYAGTQWLRVAGSTF